MAYSNQLIAAVMADLALGLSCREAAQKHGVTHPTVSKWAKNLPELSRQKPIGDLVEGQLRNEIRALDALASYAHDEAWIKQYGPNDAAIFYGVIADKAHVKLAALERAQREHQRQLDESCQAPSGQGVSN